MYKIYSYDSVTALETIEYGFAKSALKRVKELLNIAGVEVDLIEKIPFSFRNFRKCVRHHRFVRKD